MADLQTANTATLTIRRVIAAPAERIFRAWTDPAQLKSWFTPSEDVTVVSTDIDARVGGSYRITFLGKQKIPFSVSGDYRRVQPFETLAFTWTWEDSDMDVGETLVTLQLTEQGDSTELVLTHELLPAGDKRDEHEHGWNAILDSFAVYAAKPE